MITAAGAMASYGGAVAIALLRAGGHATALAPGAVLGAVFLIVALLENGRGLGLCLCLGGGTYVAFLALGHHRIDGAAPLVAVLLLLCGELSAWSLEERVPMRADAGLVWRRAGAIGLLALGGLVLATLLVLTAGSAAHGLGWTVVGAVAAVAAAGAGIVVARR